MLDIVRKEEYFDWLEKKIADPRNHTLKGIQDAWVLSLLSGTSGLKIAEVGGGRSRILQSLNQQDHECWNIDKFEGVGAGPKGVPEMAGIKVVPLYLGGFDETLPSNYFDVVFSISVVEHVPNANLDNFFADCYRILKPGGIMIHAIDLYISDEPQNIQVIKFYRQALNKLSFEWFTPPQTTKDATFESSFASNSDLTMHQWNQIAPSLRKKRETTQSVVLKLAGFKESKTDVAIEPKIKALKQLATQARTKQAQQKKTAKAASNAKANATAKVAAKANAKETPQNSKPKGQATKPQAKKAKEIAPVAAAQSQGTAQLASSLLGRIAHYYSRWPLALALVVVLLNASNFLEGLDSQVRLILTVGETIVLLFLIGHAASKSDYVLAELEKDRASR